MLVHEAKKTFPCIVADEIEIAAFFFNVEISDDQSAESLPLYIEFIQLFYIFMADGKKYCWFDGFDDISRGFFEKEGNGTAYQFTFFGKLCDHFFIGAQEIFSHK